MRWQGYECGFRLTKCRMRYQLMIHSKGMKFSEDVPS